MVSGTNGKTRTMNMKTTDIPLPGTKRMRMSMSMIMTTKIRTMIRTAEEVIGEAEQRMKMIVENIAEMKGIITGRQQTVIMIANQTGDVPGITVTEGTAIQTHHIQVHQDQNHMLGHPAGNQRVAAAMPVGSGVTVRDTL